MNYFMQKIIRLFCLFLPIAADSQGHFTGGSFNPNDYFLPANSGFVVSLYYSYTSAEFFNNRGRKTDLITIGNNPPLTIAMGTKVNTHSAIPMLIYFGKKRVLKARWGFMALPIWNNPSANIAMDFYLGQANVSASRLRVNSFGAGDFYLQPIWLSWDKKKFSTAVSYGIWVPTGKYKVNASDNIGLGYFSHNFRLAARYRPKPQVTLMGALTLEANHKQKKIDFTEAPHLTVDFGAASSLKGGHELGIFGFGMWQTGSDRGSKAVLNKDRMMGVGLFGSYWIKPGKLGLLGRFSQNFGIRNRYGGYAFQLGANILMMDYTKAY